MNTSTNTFDRLACTSNGDTSQLADQSMTASQLQSMSCADFDNAE